QRDGFRGSLAIVDPSITEAVRVTRIGIHRLKTRRHCVAEDKTVGPIRRGNRWLHGSAEVKTKIEPSELIEQIRTLTHQLQVMTHVGQLVFPVANVIWSERHLVRIKPIGQAAESFPNPQGIV